MTGELTKIQGRDGWFNEPRLQNCLGGAVD
jgi:hypothetical protein